MMTGGMPLCGWTMELYVHDRICCRAVLKYVRAIGRQTALRPRIQRVREPLDVDLGAALGRRLALDWRGPVRDWAADDSDDFGGDDRSEDGRAVSSTIAQYEKTIKALAVNTAAARAFLELTHGGQRRTAPTADENTGASTPRREERR